MPRLVFTLAGLAILLAAAVATAQEPPSEEPPGPELEIQAIGPEEFLIAQDSVSGVDWAEQLGPIQPVYDNEGAPIGIGLSELGSGSAFFQLGLRTGDVLETVDDASLVAPDDLDSLFEALSRPGSVVIHLLRRGRERTLTYHIR